MKLINKLMALATAVALMSSTLNAQDSTFIGGNGYQEYRTAPQVGPAIALGAIALAAIIAVAVQNGGNEHGHCHQ